MISERAKLNLAIALAVPGTILAGTGAWWWLAFPWYTSVGLVVVGILLVGAASQVAPRSARRPRGGPMIDPDKTLTIGRDSE